MTKHVISRLPSKPRIREFVYDARELFKKPDSAKLKNPRALDEAGKFLEENTFGLAVVATFGAEVGDTEKERVLTEAQAMVVRDYFV